MDDDADAREVTDADRQDVVTDLLGAAVGMSHALERLAALAAGARTAGEPAAADVQEAIRLLTGAKQTMIGYAERLSGKTTDPG
jgi:pyridoxal biosynthesis lyase PdxS